MERLSDRFVTQLNVLYAHRPDPQTPLNEQIQNFNDQVAKGHCKAVSLLYVIF